MRTCHFLSALVTLLALASGVRAASREYTIVPIAQAGSTFTRLTSFGSTVRPGIDASGRVFFLGKVSSSGTWFDGMYFGSGAATAPLYSVNGTVSEFIPNIRVSANGYTTFSSTVSGDPQLSRGNGGPIAAMARLSLSSEYRGYQGDVPVNDSGDALLSLLRASDNRPVIARYSGTTLTPIAVNTATTLGNPDRPLAMNTAGTALYGTDGTDADPWPDQLFAAPKSGSPVSRLSVDSVITRFFDADLSDANVITFTALTVDSKFVLGRETGPNQYTTFLETPSSNGFIGETCADAAGLIVTRAAINGGTQGVYVYDPASQQMDPVLLLGQSFAGSTITQLSLGEWNTAGQIPVALKLADGTEMIVRADPVPEPVAAGLVVCVAVAVTRRRHAR